MATETQKEIGQAHEVSQQAQVSKTLPRARKMNTIKQWWKNHSKMAKLGNAIGAAGAVIAVGGVWNFEGLKEIFTPGEIKFAITVSVICGVVGKFLTELYKDDRN